VDNVIETLNLAGLPILLVVLEDAFLGMIYRLEFLARLDVLLRGACVFHAAELGQRVILEEGAHFLGDFDYELHLAFFVRKLHDELVDLEVGHTVAVQLLSETLCLLLEQGLVV